MSVLRAILFDLGDTLVDLGEGRGSYEERLIARTGRVYDVLTAAGVTLPERAGFCARLAADSEAQYHAALAQQQGIDIFTVMRRFLQRTGIPAEDALIERAGEAYCTGGKTDRSPLRYGAVKVLQALRAQHMRLGAISNTVQPARFMRSSMRDRGLAEFLDVQIYSSDAGVAKPHPRIFCMALDALGVTADQAIYVGDRLEADIAGAQSVGMKGVLVEVSHRIEEHSQVVPDARIRELPELLDVLPRLFA